MSGYFACGRAQKIGYLPPIRIFAELLSLAFRLILFGKRTLPHKKESPSIIYGIASFEKTADDFLEGFPDIIRAI